MEALAEAIAACRPKPLFPPSTAAAPYTAVGCSDHIEHLVDDLLLHIITMLPAKDAAATSVLSRRWTSLWKDVPLRLDDACLLRRRDGARLARDGVAAAVSDVLTSHPGPVLAAHIGHCLAPDEQGDQVLAHWLRVLAAKGVRELSLLCQGQPSPLPGDVFLCSSLHRLFLGVLSLPAIPNVASFPYLQELRLCCVRVAEQDLLLLIGACPKLHTLELLASRGHIRRVSLSSDSLQRALLWKSMVKVLAIVEAPRLDRLVLWQVLPIAGGFRSRVEIGRAPELRLLGYLDPAINVLVIGGIVIKGSTKPTPRTMVPSVKVLGLKGRLGDRKQAWMIQSFLRCFPMVETLHIMCDEVHEASDANNFKFWKDISHIECVHSSVRKVSFCGVPWSNGNLEFLKFVLEGAYFLEEMTIHLPSGSHSGMHSVMLKLKLNALTSARWANNQLKMKVLPYKGDDFSYDKASDPSVIDPLDCSC